jgi:SynChlorMet cassette radical SAM/SPASM protein ScmE
MAQVAPTPSEVDIEVTSRCNLCCVYCSHFSSAGEVDQEIDNDSWIRFIEEAGSCGVLYATFTGGEPFMRTGFTDILQAVIRNRMRFRILTNGTLITPEHARFLGTCRHCEEVQVSIDGHLPELHDELRGEGSFSAAVRGIEQCKENGVPVMARVTLHRKNVRHIPQILSFLLDDLGLPAVSTNSASPLGRCRDTGDSVRLGIEERIVAMKMLLEASAGYPHRLRANAGPLAEAWQWHEMLSAQKSSSPKGKRGTLSGCGCVFSTLAVRADGIFIPCSQLSHLALGRINQDSIREVWQNCQTLKSLRSRCQIPLASLAFCQGCSFVDRCTGSCPAIAYVTTGMLDAPDPTSCLRSFLDSGGEVPCFAANRTQ